MKRLTEMKDATNQKLMYQQLCVHFAENHSMIVKMYYQQALSPTVIARTCERAFTIFNRRPIGKRYEAAVPESREYC